jgi:hypothetical protein
MSSPIEGPTRRGFLGWMGKVGITVVGGAAGVSVLGGTASAGAKNPALYTYACCHLALPNNCARNSSGNAVCPSGSTMRAWHCCMPGGSRTYACGECTTGADCNHGSFKCSAYWTSAPNKCVA